MSYLIDPKALTGLMRVDSTEGGCYRLMTTGRIYYIGVQQRVDMLCMPGDSHSLGGQKLITHPDIPPLQ